MAKKGLGMGFESLIPTDLVDDSFDPTVDMDEKVSKLTELKLVDIEPDQDQPRKEFEISALEELATSIKEHGVLQPIVVVKKGKKYVIVAGERRWRASQLAGKDTIPAIVRSMSDQNRLELSIIENAQREDLNAIELATAYAKLQSQFNLTVEDIAARVGKAVTTIRNVLRLLQLPEKVKTMMLENHIREGVVRPLITLEPKDAESVMEKIVKNDWTAREVEQYIALHIKKKSSAVATRQHIYKRQESSLKDKYGYKVRINNRSVTFSVKNEKELKELLDKLA